MSKGTVHDAAALMRGFGRARGGFAEEDEAHLACHIKGGEKGAGEAEDEGDLGDLPMLRGVQNGVLAPEAGEEKRDAAKGHHADGVGGEGDGHGFEEATHLADVLLLVAAVDDGAGAHEEKGLEEGVREQVKHADGDAAHAEAHHHVAELRHGGVGEDAFDVVLGDGDAGGENGGDGADPGDDLQAVEGAAGFRPALIKGYMRATRKTPAATMVAAWIKALTGVGPSIASGSQTWRGDLAGFADGAAENQEGDDRGNRHAAEDGVSQQRGESGLLEAAVAVVVEKEGAGLGVEQEQAEEESNIADAGGDEGFFWRRRRRSVCDARTR